MRKILKLRKILKPKYLASAFMIATLIACGGGSGGASYNVGDYNGNVSQGAYSSVLVEATVAPNGTITGKCSLFGTGSAAVIGRATLTGTVNSSTGEFNLTGFYVIYLPPPPNVEIGGQVTVTGTLPPAGSGSGPVHVENLGSTYHGVIAQIAI